MSLPPGDKPKSPITPSPSSSKGVGSSPKEKEKGKFRHRDTEPSSAESESSPSSFIRDKSTRRTSGRPKNISLEGWLRWASSPTSEDSNQGRGRAMTISSEDHESLTSPSPRQRGRTLASRPEIELTPEQVARMCSEFAQKFGVRNIEQVGAVIHAELNEDENLTLDDLEAGNKSAAPQPEVQVTPFEFDLVTTCCDLKKPGSPLNLAINQHFQKPEKLPSYELDKLQRDCSAFLSTASNLGETPPKVMQDLLLSFLQSYRTEAACLMSSSSDYNPEITQCTSFPEILKKLGLPENKTTDQLAKQLASSCKLLSVSPYPVIMQKGYEACIAEVEECQGKLQQAYEKVRYEQDHSLTCLSQDIAEIESRLKQYQEDLKTLMKNDFRSVENNMRSIITLFTAALNLIPENTTDAKQKKARETLLSLFEKAQSKVDFWPDAVPRLLGCEKLILQTLKKADLDRKYEEALIQYLQETQATPVHKEILLKGAIQTYRTQLNYSPAACIRIEPLQENPDSYEFAMSFNETDLDPFEIQYNGKFCPSMARGEEDHCVDLMTADLKIDDESIYDEIRLGVPYAFAVKDQRTRRLVTSRRWNEALTAALVQKYPEALKHAMQNQGSHKPIELDIFYDLLLSPDLFRDVTGINDPELTWSKQVFDQVQKMNEQTRVLKIKDSAGNPYEIKVKPNIFLLLTPCNELAFEKAWQVFKTWKYADEALGATLTQLFGELDPAKPIGGYVARCLQQLSPGSAEYQEITELAFWIRSMFQKGLHHQLTADPMYFPNLLTELGRVLNMANLIGCKSAKDRTGNKSQTDMKMAFQCWENRKLFQQGKTIRIVPPPCLSPSQTDLFNGCQLNLNSGQTENQAKSTGIPGFKMKGYMTGYAQGVFTAIDRKVNPKTDWLLKG